ncbi:MAG TPA: ATP-binding protein, partial [Candidatus Wallbacteria bacterium]|nr:ATP-binding protein [Candidatus Wallbacteria bacterium]
MESNRIEYKCELTEALEKEVVAFLNYRDGGIIYIGIDNTTHLPIGVPDCDEVQLKIKDRLKNNILPSCLGLFDVIHEKRQGKDVIKITLASGTEKPYYLKKMGMSEKGCFIRVGSASEPMSSRMIEELFARRTRNSIGKMRSHRQDLTFEQLKIYYNEAGFDIGEKFAANLELLTEDGAYNYAAYLLADKNGNSVQVAKYAGIDRVDLVESNEYGYCCLIKTCKQVLDKLELENRTATKITSKERMNKRLWNPVALREAVINAIIHNDYTNEAVPKFEIFDDRIEITSAGSIPPGVWQDEFFQGYSIPRNKILMRIFKDLDMVEYLGSGMPRILKAYPRDSYTFTANFIRTAFPASGKMLESSSGGVNVGVNGGGNGGVNGVVNVRVNEKEAALILAVGDLKT